MRTLEKIQKNLSWTWIILVFNSTIPFCNNFEINSSFQRPICPSGTFGDDGSLKVRNVMHSGKRVSLVSFSL